MIDIDREIGVLYRIYKYRASISDKIYVVKLYIVIKVIWTMIFINGLSTHIRKVSLVFLIISLLIDAWAILKLLYLKYTAPVLCDNLSDTQYLELHNIECRYIEIDGNIDTIKKVIILNLSIWVFGLLSCLL